jgi:hypothetical protein
LLAFISVYKNNVYHLLYLHYFSTFSMGLRSSKLHSLGKPITNAGAAWINYEDAPPSVFVSQRMVSLVVNKEAYTTFWMMLGAPSFYSGIQLRDNTKDRIVIFSVWGYIHPTTKVQTPPEVIKTGRGVKVEPFGGEGEGFKTYLPFQWRENRQYSMAITVTRDEKRSSSSETWMTLSCYFREETPTTPWTFIASVARRFSPSDDLVKSGLGTGANGFIERYLEFQAQQFASGSWANGWQYDGQKATPIKKAKLTATRDKTAGGTTIQGLLLQLNPQNDKRVNKAEVQKLEGVKFDLFPGEADPPAKFPLDESATDNNMRQTASELRRPNPKLIFASLCISVLVIITLLYVYRDTLVVRQWATVMRNVLRVHVNLLPVPTRYRLRLEPM